MFLALARAGSLTKAARQLGVSVPTLSRDLSEFEEKMGATFFDRLPTGLGLTDAGNSILELAEVIESEVKAMDQAISNSTAKRKRAVRVTATASIATFLARYLKAGAPDDPAIEVLSSGNVASLARREADIALRMRGYPSEGALTVRRLCTLRFTLYGGINMADALEPIVGFSHDCYPSEQGTWLDSLSTAQQPLRFSETWLRYEAAAGSNGATVLPCFIGDTDSRLHRLLEPPKELDEEVFLIVHSNQRHSLDVKKTLGRISQVFKQHQAILEGRLGQHGDQS